MAAASSTQINLRPSAIQEILGRAGSVVGNAGIKVTNTISSVTGPETGSYILKVIYYLLMYSFFIFIILLLVHFTVKPIFRFVPGGKGVIGLPGTSDDKVYWNDRKQPLPRSMAPLETDDLASYQFDKNFSFSLDLYVRKLPDTAVKNRIILIKSTVPDASGNTLFKSAPADAVTNLESYMNTSTTIASVTYKQKANMIMYLTETNDLVVTFFNNDSSGNSIAYASRPIYNIPLYTPFRITVVTEERMFTLYMNGKQVFQRIIPNTLAASTPQRFYSPPSWAESPSKTIFLQNFHLWPRMINGTEVEQAQPALARAADFNMPAEAGGTSCY